MNLGFGLDVIKANIPEVKEAEWVDVLPIIMEHSAKVEHYPEQKLIAVADNCDWIVGFLDGLDYSCDNTMFGRKPNRADGLLVYYDPDDHSSKGYLIVTKEAIEKCLAC